MCAWMGVSVSVRVRVRVSVSVCRCRQESVCVEANRDSKKKRKRRSKPIALESQGAHEGMCVLLSHSLVCRLFPFLLRRIYYSEYLITADSEDRQREDFFFIFYHGCTFTAEGEVAPVNGTAVLVSFEGRLHFPSQVSAIRWLLTSIHSYMCRAA